MPSMECASVLGKAFNFSCRTLQYFLKRGYLVIKEGEILVSGKLGGNVLEPNHVKLQSDYKRPTGLIQQTSVLQIFLLRSFSVLLFLMEKCLA